MSVTKTDGAVAPSVSIMHRQLSLAAHCQCDEDADDEEPNTELLRDLCESLFKSGLAFERRGRFTPNGTAKALVLGLLDCDDEYHRDAQHDLDKTQSCVKVMHRFIS